MTGRKQLSFATGISEQSIRTSLGILRTINFLTIKSTSKFSIISICKYNKYQEKSTTKITNNQPASNQQVTTNKNDKNVKNDKNTTIAPDKPDAVEGPKPVNWENCRTDLQRFIAHYVKIEFPYLYEHATPTQACGIFKRYGRSASEILAVASSLPIAIAAFDSARAFFIKKALSWNLATVARNIGEFVNEKIREAAENELKTRE